MLMTPALVKADTGWGCADRASTTMGNAWEGPGNHSLVLGHSAAMHSQGEQLFLVFLPPLSVQGSCKEEHTDKAQPLGAGNKCGPAGQASR